MNYLKISLFIFFFLKLNLSFAQRISWTELAPMPDRVTNNAIAQATVNDVPFIYSFSGIDSTKACNATHLNAFKYNTLDNSWERLDELPDPRGGKIAAGASTLKNKIYIIGGYHVSNSCNEISSTKVHVFDPELNQYLDDGADIPVAIDDHVQAVWKDSLIYVITGWSNTTNVRDVQIYNPSTDTWLEGTPIPNNSNWRVFGGSGTIIGNTIYYLGGANPSCEPSSCFPPTQYFRKGVIDPQDPTKIEWSSRVDELSQGYRMAASSFEGNAIWLGGSDLTYNFDGIDYNGTGGVSPLDRITILNVQTENLTQLFGQIPAVMDLRGVAKISENDFIIIGGMEANQVVSNKVYKISIDALTSDEDIFEESLDIFPNPFDDIVHLELEGDYSYFIYNISASKMAEGRFSDSMTLDVTNYPSGIYFIKIYNGKDVNLSKKLIKQ